ncbi:hypothetical protein HPP92_002031 [Vanilla planifolia]|uniref:Uncharacterized protein n=1 Tax=Vanilla planifolia TaxID=51239 RepID=A0A835RZ51_VANPL|nr:hypothetical protein HPP92_002031 [Vanilla planifolia]
MEKQAMCFLKRAINKFHQLRTVLAVEWRTQKTSWLRLTLMSYLHFLALCDSPYDLMAGARKANFTRFALPITSLLLLPSSMRRRRRRRRRRERREVISLPFHPVADFPL